MLCILVTAVSIKYHTHVHMLLPKEGYIRFNFTAGAVHVKQLSDYIQVSVSILYHRLFINSSYLHIIYLCTCTW